MQIGQVIDDCECYPLRVDAQWTELEFVRVPLALRKQVAFHDLRGLKRAKRIGAFPIEYVARACGKLAPERRSVAAVFHTAFCGSTLLSHYLRELGVQNVYREPKLFTQLSVQRWVGFRKCDEATWRSVFDAGMTLLSRGDSGAAIKFHDAGISLIGDVLDWHPAVRGIILYSELPIFMLQI